MDDRESRQLSVDANWRRCGAVGAELSKTGARSEVVRPKRRGGAINRLLNPFAPAHNPPAPGAY